MTGFYLGSPAEVVEDVGGGWCRARVAEHDPPQTKRQRQANERVWRMWRAQIKAEPWGTEPA